MPAVRCSQVLALESSRSSITPGAPELSIFTTSSASSAGPVIWLRWSKHHSGSSICHACMVETEGGRKSGWLPAWASWSDVSRRAISARWRSVSAACSGARNSRKPAGRARAGLNSGGAELTATVRFEKGRGASAGFGLVVADAMVEVSPFRYEFERKPAGELERQFEGQPAATSNL